MDAEKTQNIKMLMGLIKVLTVEDEPYSRKVVRTLLNATGVEKIFEAKDGASGLEAIQTHNPDIVLLDWEMPGMNGAESCATCGRRRNSCIRPCLSSCLPATAKNRAVMEAWISACTSSCSSRCRPPRC